MLDLANFVLEATGSSSPITFEPLPVDDPTRRCPDITLAAARAGLGASYQPRRRELHAPSTISLAR